MQRSLKDFVDAALTEVTEVSPADVATGEHGDWLILDVREPDEFAAGHIPGALSYPRGFLEVRADLDHPKRDEKLADRSQRIVCYCGGGHRSALAAQTLKQMGFDTVVSMAGGWTRWTAEGHPINGDQ